MRLRTATRCLYLVFIVALVGQGLVYGLEWMRHVSLRYDNRPVSNVSTWAPETGRVGSIERGNTLKQPERGEIHLDVRLARTQLAADGRDSALVVVLATDESGRPVPDGTRLTLEASGGHLSTHDVQTTDGLAYVRLQAGVVDGPGQVTVHREGASHFSGQESATVPFTVQAVEEGVLRLDEGDATAVPGVGGAPLDVAQGLPFDVAELVERARNAVRIPEPGLPQVETPVHRAQFGAGQMQFTPFDTEGEPGPSLAVALSSITIGEATLFAGPQPAALLVEGNVARYERAPELAEEFVARDAGIEQRWWLAEPPQGSGDLVIEVEVETALVLALAPLGNGFLFRSGEPTTVVQSGSQLEGAEQGVMETVATYGRAVAIDADGRSLHADLNSETLAPATPGLNRYRLVMSFSAAWLAEAVYPLLVDPLIGGQLRLDGVTTQAGVQRRTAVAYNSTNDEYLVGWEDDRAGITRIYGQIVATDGVLLGDNFTIASSSANHYTAPDVAYNRDANSYLVAWTSSNGQAMARIVNSDRSVGPTLSLGVTGYTQNSSPAVAYSAEADAWLATWQRYNRNNNYDIGARTVAADSSLGSAFVVADGSHDEATPDVTANDSGGFLITWEEAAGGSYDLSARRATTTGVDGSAFALTTAAGAQVAPALTYNGDDDEYLAVWQDWSDGAGGGYDAIWGQRIYGTAGSGTLAGSPFEVSGSEQADSGLPAVTYYADAGSGGLYLVAWEQMESGAHDLQAQRVLTDGTALGSVITLASAAGDQQEVALAFGPAPGTTLAAWIDERAGDPDVYARVAHADGSLEDEFLVHTAAGDQGAPQVAYNPDADEYLVVWHDYRTGAADGDIYGQRVSGSGAPVGNNITVTMAAYNQLYPQVAYAPGEDTYLVTWRSHITETIYYDVAGQRLAGDGTLLGSELLIGASSGVLYQDGPSDVVYNSISSRFLVLWAATDAWARHVSVTGTMESPLQVTSEAGSEYGVRAAYNAADDQYLLVWEQFDPASERYNILGRRMTGSGVVTNTETIYIAAGAPDQKAPDVAYLPGAERYAVVWQDARNSHTAGTDIYGQLVTVAGALDGGHFQVAGASQREIAPRLDTDGAGGALVLWARDNGAGAGRDLYGRRLDGQGQLMGEAFSILETAGNQEQAALAGNGGDRYFLAWRDSRNGSADIYGSLFAYLVAGFSATPTSGAAPLVVQFSDESTPTAAADAWSWDFGDGSTSTAQHPVYTYTQSGVYSVTLAITNTATGETDAQVVTSYITAGDGGTVLADFSASPLSGSAPLTVTFTNHSTGATGFSWDFGDGITATMTSPTHVYTQAGVYTVTLTASGAGGSDVLTRTDYITVTRSWRPVATTTNPPVWGEYAAAYDSNRDVVVLYGGNAGGWPYEDTTWEFDGSDWTAMTTTQQPAAVYGMQSVFDSEQGRVLLFGGSNSDDTPVDETRVYSGTAWTALTPAQSPPARTNHALAYDPVAGNAYLFGGNAGPTYFKDLWRYYEGGAWTQVVVSGTAPPARTLSALVYDAAGGRLLLFGGRDAAGAPLADLWAFDTTTHVWTELAAVGPAPRYAHAMAYDPATGAVIVVGGVADAGETRFGDTWQFRNGDWTALEASPLPAGVAYHTLVYHENAQAFLLVTDGETWEYR